VTLRLLAEKGAAFRLAHAQEEVILDSIRMHGLACRAQVHVCRMYSLRGNRVMETTLVTLCAVLVHVARSVLAMALRSQVIHVEYL
jgi:hypothetical protein